VVDAWLEEHNGLQELPASRRKLEWQAQDAASLWETVMHFRPSGIRAKRPTYLPALVAITQTSIVGSRRRRITPREAARLQGLPDWFHFAGQPDAATYRQLGNGVNVGAAYYVLRQHVLNDAEDIAVTAPGLVEKVVGAAPSPDEVLEARPLAMAAEGRDGGPVIDLAGKPQLAAR
jgi:DNA (cytosine-5)-methyltransferase 1